MSKKSKKKKPGNTTNSVPSDNKKRARLKWWQENDPRSYESSNGGPQWKTGLSLTGKNGCGPM